MSTDLVGIASSQFFRHVQAAAVLYEAAVGPVCVIETEGATAVAVPGVLDGDGAGHHGDDAAAACILLSLRRRKTLEILKKPDYFFTLPTLTVSQQSFCPALLIVFILLCVPVFDFLLWPGLP